MMSPALGPPVDPAGGLAVAGQAGPFRVMMTVDAVGGVWRYAMELGAALSELGINVDFAGLGPAPTPEQRSEASRIGTLTWLDQPLDWMCDEPAALGQVGAALGALAEETGAELIHLNLPSQAADLASNLPVVVVAHSCLATWWQEVRDEPLPGSHAWHARYTMRGLMRADCIVAPSASFGAQLLRSYGPLPRLEVVHNALPQSCGVEPKEPFAFAAGRWWDEGKNGRVIDAAAADVEWPLLMAGALAGASGSGLSCVNATALGPLPYDRLLDRVGRAAIVVSASLYEPFGLSALEGAMAGAALVLSDIPTYRELWHDAALFFSPRDSRDLARCINRLADDAALRATLGHAALRRASEFRPELQARSMQGVYAHALEARALAARCAS